MFCRFPPYISARGRKSVKMSFISDKELRSYLLGTLADVPREHIEDTLLVGDEGLLRLEMAEEDLIEEFLDGQLDAEQLDLFESHFLCTKARKEKLAYLRAIRAVAARQMEPESATDKVINFPATQTRRSFFVGMNRSSYLKLAAAILIVASAGFLVWRYALRPSQDASLVALNRAYASGRTLETRIGRLDYAPYAPTRGANDADTNARILRERAERIVLDAYAEHPTAANRHALGKYYLADKQFDKAIEQFNAALKETPTVAELHNDMGAALLEKSKYEKCNNQPGDSLQHMAASLESIQQALKLQPNYPAAVFNRALCLQEMYLPRQAIEEWKKYLQLDGKSPWADEARRRLAELEKAPSSISKSDDELYQEYLRDPANDDRTFDLFCQSYSTTGNGITERLIDNYLGARKQGDINATAHDLDLLKELGALVYLRTTDPYVRDVARFYQELSARHLETIIQARYHLNEGRKLRSTSQSQAAVNYQQAIALFGQVRDECEVKMTTCLLARSYLQQSDLEKSREIFRASTALNNEYLWLRAESLNGIANYYERQNQPDEAISNHRLELIVAEQINNWGLIATSLSTLATLYCELGNSEQAIFYQQQALASLIPREVRHPQYWVVNNEAASNLFTLGFQSAALTYQQEALRIEQVTQRPLQLSRTYTHLGILLGKEMRFTEAIQALEEAIKIGNNLGNERVGLGIKAYSGLHMANLQRKAGNFPAALRGYESVINFYRVLKVSAEDFEIYRGKALTEIALGYTAQAKQDLTQALAIFEMNRDQIFAEKDRDTFFDKEYEIYDAAISFAFADNPSAAFDLSEKSRARSLLELMKGIRFVNSTKAASVEPSVNQAQPFFSNTVRRQIPQGASLLEFACLPDRLLVWGVSANGFTYNQTTIPLAMLEQKVFAFLQVLSSKTPSDIRETTALSAELYEILIGPLEPFLAKGETVCIVPDKVLFHLPFAALFSSRQQKYLIENYALITAPSASVFLLCAERSHRLQSSTYERVLAVGNPRFDQAVYAQLLDLTAAAREANDISRNYPNSIVLTAEHATEQSVKAEIKAASIIHLATHGLIDKRYSLNSRFILAKPAIKDSEDGELRAYEISSMRLPLTRLAVLSACQSGVERFYRGEGMVGLSRAFLAAGVPTVVASNWMVDSEVTAILMVGFHQQLKQQGVSQALRHAQLSMLHDTNSRHRSPYYWAAFSVYGGDVL